MRLDGGWARPRGMTTPAPEQAFAPPPSLIRWPEKYLPANANVFAHNEIVIAAPPERVWAWLLRAQLWPEWYENSANVHFLSHTGPDLRDRSRFRWKTFGVRITSKVLEFEPERRLAWDAHGIGVDAYHAWVLTPVGDGSTQVVTEETQSGWLARLGAVLMPKRMQAKHQLWLEGLSEQAQSGMPPVPPVAPL
jgi:uncharacterized protein YndB with AHSA1/START domain